MSDFYREKVIFKSRKDHNCFLCKQKIPKGCSYLYDCGVYFGDFFSRHSHLECADKWRDMNSEEPSDDWTEFYLIQEVYPHISLERWRKVINHMYRGL